MSKKAILNGPNTSKINGTDHTTRTIKTELGRQESSKKTEKLGGGTADTGARKQDE